MFKVKGYNHPLISEDYPTFSLSTDSWDDYGTLCTFHLRYHETKYKAVNIGRIKIIQFDVSKTILPPKFQNLTNEYISLGQDIDFYKKIYQTLGAELAAKTLESLNDIAWQPNIAEAFESKSQYRNALLRENSAQNAFRFGRTVILNEEYDENFSFIYTTKINGADNQVTISVDFDDDDYLPGRIVGIIGQNAVGKTQLLGSLAKDLVQLRRVSKKTIDDKNKKFEGKRPTFTRVITVSYSAFDGFIRPNKPQVSYVYCGLRNENNALSKSSLVENYKRNLLKIIELGRSNSWISFMSEILDKSDKNFVEKLENELKNADNSNDDTLSLLSSGQSILVHFVTALVARIQSNTLILFDEPETHLHPNAVAHLFNVLNKILKTYNSFAIIATHSPIVIQEIPRKRVILLTREGNSTISSPMSFETFGENISELTRHVFDTVNIPNPYKAVFKKLSRKMTFEEINSLFDDGLGFNAKAYLLGQYGEEK